MDVRCGRCGTAYELDAGSGPSTTAFKCSTCGHIFAAGGERSAETMTYTAHGSMSTSESSLSPARAGEWLVRKPDGRVLMAQDFTTLRNWVVDRSARREDEVSRTGRSWKRLGDVAELGSFFEVVETAEINARAQLLAQGASLPPSSSAAGPLASPAVDPAPSRQQRSRAPVVPVVGGAVLVLAVAVAWLRAPGVSEPGPAASVAVETEAAVVAVARAAVRSDTREAIDAARAALAALAPTARVLAWQARLDVALASHAREEARLHELLGRLEAPAPSSAPEGSPAEAPPSADPGRTAPRAAAAARRRQDAASLLATAYASLTRARGEARRLADVHLASAAYHLEKRAWVELRTDLETAQETGGADPVVRAEVDALTALTSGATGLRDDPRAALADVPASTDDGRLRSMRAALTVNALVPPEGVQVLPDADFKAAKAILATLPRPDVRAELLVSIVEKLELVAGAFHHGPAGGAPGAGPATGLEAASYEVIMQRAERARLNDRSRDAWELFSLAARKKPTAPRPWLAAGWAALDIGRKADATAAFERALELDDALGEAWFGLAEASNFSGKRELALAAYRRYLELEPTGKDSDVARRAIDALE